MKVSNNTQHPLHDDLSFRKSMVLFSLQPNCDWLELKLKFAVSPLCPSSSASLLEVLLEVYAVVS